MCDNNSLNHISKLSISWIHKCSQDYLNKVSYKKTPKYDTNIDYGSIIVIAVAVHFTHTLPTIILMGRTFYNCRKAEKIY